MSRRRGAAGAAGGIRGPSSALTSFLAGLGVEPAGRLTTWGNSADIAGNDQLAPDGPVSEADTSLDPAGALTARTVEAGPSQVGENTSERTDDELKKRRSSQELEAPIKRRALSVDSEDLDAEQSSRASETATPVPRRRRHVSPSPLRAVGDFMDCGECGKRFTVTPYTKEHPNKKSTWLCLECCYGLGVDPFAKPKKVPKKAVQKKENRGKVVHYEQRKGVTNLGDLCIQMIGKYIEDVDALGDIGSVNMDKVCKIISKSRRLGPETAPLFYSPDRLDLAMYDCTRLVPESYLALARLCPNLERLHLHLCGQLSTEAVAMWGMHLARLQSIELFAPFLVRKEGWISFFEGRGKMLESLSITQSPRIDSDTITKLVESCPNIKALRLSEIGKLDNDCLVPLAKLNLTSLAISAPGQTLSDEAVSALLHSCTSITSLDLSDNPELSDAILPAIAPLPLLNLHLRNLVELTDDGVADFFANTASVGFKVIDLEKGHDLRGSALRAMLRHSGHSLEGLSIMGWREVDADALSLLGSCKRLRALNVGWCRQVTDFTMKDILEGCDELQSVRVWGCNQLTDAVPRGSASPISISPPFHEQNLRMPVKDRPSDRTSTSRRTFEDGDDSDWPPRPSPERETEEQRTERLEREREAKRVSDDIDCELEAEKIERRKRKPDVKILLLGQAESGKSTMLRNFQLQYTPQAFRTEAEAWSAIIHLNLVRSVNFILSLLLERERESLSQQPHTHTHTNTHTHGPQTNPDGKTVSVTPRSSTSSGPENAEKDGSAGSLAGHASVAGSASRSGSLTGHGDGKSSMALTDELRRLRMRLSPLRSVEEAFLKFVTGSADPHTVASAVGGAQYSSGSLQNTALNSNSSPDDFVNPSGNPTSTTTYPPTALNTNSNTDLQFDPRVGSTTSWQRKKGYERTFEVSVKSGSRWKSLFRPLSGMSSSGQPVNGAGGKAGVYDELKNARMVLAACRDDILALWENPVVKTALAKESMMLEFQSGFFLDQVERIAAPGYMPTSGDVLKARIETMGVEEHLLKMETGGIRGFNNTWAIYDVGGSRSQRAAWLPYFDDVNMILFIAPVSAFNQVLAEDRSVNRLWDTIFLWKSICGSKLLQKVEFVLLLNKYDILEAKLNSGVLFRKFVTSYKDKPNDIQSVLSYLKGKFAMIYKQNRQSGGMLHIHVTCATDANATSVVLGRIRQSIFTEHFEKADLL